MRRGHRPRRICIIVFLCYTLLMITLYTDGSSKGNPGPGGWGSFVLHHDEQYVIELGGHEDHTTNNRMELMAAIEGLHHIEKKYTANVKVTVYADSAYVLNGIMTWVYGWEKNGWKTSKGDPVLNRELWERFIQVVRRFKLDGEILFTKVKGHAGVFENERVDTIATSFADGTRPLLYVGAQAEYERLYQVKL